jgi:putative transcription factor
VRCEVCGNKIFGKPYTAIIEGARLTVCGECAKHGKIIYEQPQRQQASMIQRKPTPLRTRPTARKPPETPPAETGTELVEGYQAKIRQAREKLGLSHEDLGKRINEKVSLLRKIETGKMKPNNQLATRLEHTLTIKLIVPATDEKLKVPQTKITKTPSREVTLGDLLQIGEDKPKEKTTKRK